MSYRVDCCGSCVVSLCSQWREQAFRDGSSVCYRNPSGCLSQGACFSLLPIGSMNMSHVNCIHYMYSTFMAVVVWLLGTPSFSGSSLWCWGPCCLTNRLPPTALSGPQAHCCCVTSTPSQSWGCCTAAVLVVCFQVFLGATVSLLNNPLVTHQGSNSIIISGGVVDYILAVLRDQMYPSNTVRWLPVFPFSTKGHRCVGG